MDPLPPFETARAQSEFFAVQCHQLEPILNGQLIRKYKEIPMHRENIQIPKADGPLHLKLPNHRGNSSLFNVINESPFETVNL